ALDPVLHRPPRRQRARKRLLRPLHGAQQHELAPLVVDAHPEAAPRLGVVALPLDLVLLRREGQAVGVAATLDLRRPPVPDEAADRRAVVDELVVVELRPAEPGPPLRPLLALVVVEQVCEQAARLALGG